MYKNCTLTKTVAILVFISCLVQKLHAQKQPVDAAKVRSLVEANASAIRMSTSDRQNSRIQDAYYSNQSGLLLVYLQQTYKGVDVYNATTVLAFKGDKLVSATGAVIPKIQSRVNNTEGIPGQRPENAVAAAARHLNLPVASSAKPNNYKDGDKEAEFSDMGISSENIETKLMWVPSTDGQRLTLCWQVQIQPQKTADHWLVRIDAGTGKYVNKSNLTVTCSWKAPHRHTADCYEEKDYNAGDEAAPEIKTFKDPAAISSAKYRVIQYPVASPVYKGGNPTLVTNPWLLAPPGSPATTLKWNDDSTTTYAITRGNNVFVQDDHDANNATIGQSAISKTAIPDLDFDYTPNFAGEPADSLNFGFALTNLFYWNNIMHDLTYQYGFDEVSGNFQNANLGRGGKGKDYVIADGQDAVAVDNSNFATPPDGKSPRMQMFLFDYDGSKVVHVNSPAGAVGYHYAQQGEMSDNNLLENVGPITANLILYNGTDGTDLGCTAAANAAALKNNIALIERQSGGCGFATKVKNAQLAGAKAVIIMNQTPGAGVIVMSGNDNSITIPAVMISYEDGTALKSLLAGGATVNITLFQHMLDGSVDASVMGHEYTHGISNRLTGGPANTSCLENAEQMGEGWSDYYALMATTDWTKAQLTDGTKPRAIGAYVLGEDSTGTGIRTFPYTTNMSVNPWTYDMVATETGGEVHLVGEIWCTALWEMTWDIIQQDGLINTNFFNAGNAGGNTVALKLVTEAMKLQRCSPGFIDGRDAILKADTLLYNGKYSCSIWKAFAKRGMGIKASEGSSYSYTDQVADYTVPGGARIVKHVDKDSAVQTDVLTYTLTPTCKCADLTDLKVVDTLPASVTYVSGGTYNSANRTVTFSGINLTASQSVNLTVKVKINAGTYFKPVTVLADSVTTNTIPANAWKNVSTSSSSWVVSTARHKTGSYSYLARDSANPNNEMLVSAKAYAITGVTELSFWHYYDTEDGYDGGVVEASADNGTTWVDLGPYMVQNAYNNSIDPNNGTILEGRSAFSGTSGGFIKTRIDLSSFSGKSIMLRFAFACDDLQGGDGWYIDDINISHFAAVINNVQLYNAGNSLMSIADTISVIKAGALPLTWGKFNAVKQNNTALLTWNTLYEINTGRFAVERSADGNNYKEIGSVQAAGTGGGKADYTFTDAAPLQGVNYYRIKEYDKDGKFNYSDVRSLTFDGINGVVSISPNPAKSKVSVTVSGNTKPLKVYLVNGAGQKLQSYDMAGEYLQINLPPVAAGVYYIRIEGDGTSYDHKLVIQ